MSQTLTKAKAFTIYPESVRYSIEDIPQYLKIFVVENLIGDEIDILIDQESANYLFRVNGKGTGDTYKFWTSFVKKHIDLDHFTQFGPIPFGILTLVGSEAENEDQKTVVRLKSVRVINKEDNKAHYVKFIELEKLAKQFRIQLIPPIFRGNLRLDTLKELNAKSYTGLPRKGLLIVTEDPVEYIKYNPSEVEGRKLINPKNWNWANNLANEFSKIAADEKFAISHSTLTDPNTLYIIALTAAQNELLYDEYIRRCQEECFLEENEAKSLLNSVLRVHIQDLHNEFCLKENKDET